MSQFERTLRAVSRDLTAAGVHWAFVGGLAVSVRTRPRFTQDLDIAIAVAANSEAERIVFELRGKGYEPLALLEHDQSGRLATVRLSPPGALGSDIITDLLFSACGIEHEVVDEAEVVEIYPGITAPTARVGHLLAMKTLSLAEHRQHDHRDLGWLFEVADERELQRARAGLALIEEGGFNREKDLLGEFEGLLTKYRESPWD